VGRLTLPAAPASVQTVAAVIGVRPATPGEAPVLQMLIDASARGLSRGHYDDEQVEAAVRKVFGIDSELIEDGTYLVAEVNGEIVACGGWSWRSTLFGGDQFVGRATGFLDPARDPARIRAFFVAPGWARQGVGTALLRASEDRAREAGFGAAQLMATLPGQPFYAAHGYVVGEPLTLDLDGVKLPFVTMTKILARTADDLGGGAIAHQD